MQYPRPIDYFFDILAIIGIIFALFLIVRGYKATHPNEYIAPERQLDKEIIPMWRESA